MHAKCQAWLNCITNESCCRRRWAVISFSERGLRQSQNAMCFVIDKRGGGERERGCTIRVMNSCRVVDLLREKRYAFIFLFRDANGFPILCERWQPTGPNSRPRLIIQSLRLCVSLGIRNKYVNTLFSTIHIYINTPL
jgi:hypothetical protein